MHITRTLSHPHTLTHSHRPPKTQTRTAALASAGLARTVGTGVSVRLLWLLRQTTTNAVTKATEIHSLSIVEARSLSSRCLYSHSLRRPWGGSFPSLPAPGGPDIAGLWPHRSGLRLHLQEASSSPAVCLTRTLVVTSGAPSTVQCSIVLRLWSEAVLTGLWGLGRGHAFFRATI